MDRCSRERRSLENRDRVTHMELELVRLDVTQEVERAVAVNVGGAAGRLPRLANEPHVGAGQRDRRRSTRVASRAGPERMATGTTPFDPRLMVFGNVPGLMSMGTVIGPDGVVTGCTSMDVSTVPRDAEVRTATSPVGVVVTASV